VERQASPDSLDPSFTHEMNKRKQRVGVFPATTIAPPWRSHKSTHQLPRRAKRKPSPPARTFPSAKFQGNAWSRKLRPRMAWPDHTNSFTLTLGLFAKNTRLSHDEPALPLRWKYDEVMNPGGAKGLTGEFSEIRGCRESLGIFLSQSDRCSKAWDFGIRPRLARRTKEVRRQGPLFGTA
jgi:hypothetical protein